MEGSAAVIGTMMLPILGSADPAAAREPARQLGLAFQLTNFIRDVAEDLDRGRIYLPAEDLAGSGSAGPTWPPRAGHARRSEQLIAYEVEPGPGALRAPPRPASPLLDPASQACIRTAFHLYGGILDEVERGRLRRLRPPGGGPPPPPPRRRRPPPDRRPGRRPGRAPRQRRHPRHHMILRVAVALRSWPAGSG